MAASNKTQMVFSHNNSVIVNNENSRGLTEINGESMFMMWQTLGLRTAEEQNRTINDYPIHSCL